MIREERDPAWWQAVAEHPQVAPNIFLGDAFDLSAIVAHDRVLPMAAEHGGFLLAQLDAAGRVYEWHTLFTPEGWGREANEAAKATYEAMAARGAQIITTYEVEGHYSSLPPKSHGWNPAGPFEPTQHGSMRSWVLTREAWRASPAYQRMARCRS